MVSFLRFFSSLSTHTRRIDLTLFTVLKLEIGERYYVPFLSTNVVFAVRPKLNSDAWLLSPYARL